VKTKRSGVRRRKRRRDDEKPSNGGKVMGWLTGGVVLLLLAGAAVWYYLAWRGGDKGSEGRQFLGHDQEVTCVAVSPDGKSGVSGGKDGTVRVWNLEDGVEKSQVKNLPLDVRAICWSPRENKVLFGGSLRDGAQDKFTLCEWETKPGAPAKRLPHDSPVRCLAFLPNGKAALAAGGSGPDAGCALHLWDWSTGEEHLLSGHTDEVLGLAVTADDARAISCSRDGTVRIWDLANRKEERRLKPNSKDKVLSVTVSPDGKLLATGGEAIVSVYDLSTMQETARCQGHKNDVLCLAFTPDGKRLVSGSADGTLRVWDVESGKELTAFLGHVGRVNGVAVTPDGKHVLSGGEDRTVRLWTLPR
jgi:WD40 repeat protein